tara:strand:- start:3541 stop:4140 length:600 start_codon:yes stop_codon:yes gene_type:complete
MNLQTIPAGRGVAIVLSSGSEIIVINTHGTQVLDTWAFNLDDPSEYMSMEHTRSRLSRLSPRTGDKLFSNRRRPILALLEDTSPGIHDTLLCACNKEIYRELGCDDGHRSCESNLHEALSFIDHEIALTPAPLNLFMNVPVAPDGTIDRVPPQSRPGDLVRLQTVMNTIIVFSACPQDVTPINGAQCIPRDAHYTTITP